jgi:hypothetical protein
MAIRKWRVEVGFNKFDGCQEKHKAFEICDGCREHQGVMRMKVSSINPTLAAWLAVDRFGESEYFSAGYQIVTLTMDGDSTERLPSLPRPSRRKPGSPLARKGSTETTTSGGRGRGGKDQRTK